MMTPKTCSHAASLSSENTLPAKASILLPLTDPTHPSLSTVSYHHLRILTLLYTAQRWNVDALRKIIHQPVTDRHWSDGAAVCSK